LKVLGGHFTSSEQVDSYTQKPNIVENTKIEVCYARDTSLAVPETSDIVNARL